MNFDSCQPEVVSDVISGTADQDVSMDVCANFCDSTLKPSVGGVMFGPFANTDNFRPEVRIDVLSGVVVDPMGMKVSGKFGDSRSNRSRHIRLPHFVRTTTTTDGPYDNCLKRSNIM